MVTSTPSGRRAAGSPRRARSPCEVRLDGTAMRSRAAGRTSDAVGREDAERVHENDGPRAAVAPSRGGRGTRPVPPGRIDRKNETASPARARGSSLDRRASPAAGPSYALSTGGGSRGSITTPSRRSGARFTSRRCIARTRRSSREPMAHLRTAASSRRDRGKPRSMRDARLGERRRSAL